MNRILVKLMPGTVLMGVLILSAGAWSMGPPRGHDVDKILAYMAHELELTQSQQAQVNILVEENSGVGKADQQRLGEIREEMIAMRGDFDAGSAQKLADELGEITARLAYRMASTQAEIYQLLTPEQRQQMLALVEKRDERMEKRWAKHRD